MTASTSLSAWFRAHSFAIAFVAALSAGAAARFTGIGWGLPYNLHVDEVQGTLRGPVRIEWSTIKLGWPKPQLVSYGALPAYVFIRAKNLVWGSRIAQEWAAKTNDWDDYAEKAYRHDHTPGTYFWPSITLMMRAIAAAMYTVALALTGLSAKRLWGERVAVLTVVAGGGMAALVQHAHFFTGEAFIVLGLTMLLHASLRIADGLRYRDFLYAAAGLEIATNAKVTTAPLAVVVVLACFEYFRKKQRRPLLGAVRATFDSGRLWACATLWIVGWFFLNPAAMRNLEYYFSEDTPASVTSMMKAFRRGGPLSDWALYYDGLPRFYFATRVMSDALGAAYAVLAWLGCGWVLLVERGPRRWPAIIILLVLGGLWLTALHTVRYVVPALPFFAMCVARLGAFGWDEATRWARRRASDPGASPTRGEPPRVRVLASALAGASYVVAVGTGWFLAVAMVRLHLQPENRVSALHWLWAHASPTDRVVVPDHPFYRPPVNSLWGVGSEIDPPTLAYDYLWGGGEVPNIRDARYVVLDGWEMRLPGTPRYWREHPGRAKFYASVGERGAPPGYHSVARFDNRPNLFGWERDESSMEIFSFAFDHLPLYIYERD